MALAAAAALAFATGCGRTKIITNEPTATVIVDGEVVGHGTGEVRKRGLPSKATVVVETPDGRRQTKVIDRDFTWTTFFIGWFTYGVGFVVAWEYPGSVFLPFEPAADTPKSGWDAEDDVWTRPPPGWEPRSSDDGPPPDPRPAPD